MMSDEFKQTLLNAFIGEAEEILAQINTLLQQRWNSDVAHELFRHFHSLKGTAQLVEYPHFASAASTAETLARSGNSLTHIELVSIAQYLQQSLAQIKEQQPEAEPYNVESLDKLIAHIQSQALTAQQEQRALFQLFAKQLTGLNPSDQTDTRTRLNKLISAAELMEFTDLTPTLSTLKRQQHSTGQSLQQQIIDTLAAHKSFGNAFIEFYTKATP